MTDRFRGTYTVMVTAFDTEGRVDLEAQARFTDWQVREGIHGLIPLGSTGEFLSMSPEERRDVAKCVIDTVAGRVPVLRVPTMSLTMSGWPKSSAQMAR
jgi:4-hydroxy-tetrahydrodipicolinate synthase